MAELSTLHEEVIKRVCVLLGSTRSDDVEQHSELAAYMKTLTFEELAELHDEISKYGRAKYIRGHPAVKYPIETDIKCYCKNMQGVPGVEGKCYCKDKDFLRNLISRCYCRQAEKIKKEIQDLRVNRTGYNMRSIVRKSERKISKIPVRIGRCLCKKKRSFTKLRLRKSNSNIKDKMVDLTVDVNIKKGFL